MTKQIAKIPDCELEIMLIIWDAKEAVTSAYILKELEGKKNWGITTVLNFLSRLQERGFLSMEKQGRINYYLPLVKETDYIQAESKTFLEKLHNNSVKSLVASLYGGKGISKQDWEELKKFIEEAK